MSPNAQAACREATDLALTAAAFLTATVRLPLLPAAALADLAPVIVLAPHPDDESLACGGLIALLRSHGLPVRLVVVSDGAASHPGSREFPPERLREVRQGELLAAAGELGLLPHAIALLELPDGRVPRRDGPGFADALRRLEGAGGGQRPRTLVASWRLDPHGDHMATYELARALQQRLEPPPRLLEYVVWGWTLPSNAPVGGGAPSGFRLVTDLVREQKRRAIACHRSQLGELIRDDPSGWALDPAMVARCIEEPELFLELPP